MAKNCHLQFKMMFDQKTQVEEVCVKSKFVNNSTNNG